MSKEIFATGKTIDEAIAAACSELGVDNLDGLDFEIVDMPKKSLFKKSVPAKIKVTVPESKAQVALDYLQSILDAMGLNGITMQADEKEEGAVITLAGEGLNVVIGRHGETLDSLQYLTGLVASRASGEYYRITLDCGNFRDRREKTLQSLARRMAQQAVRTGRSMTLEPMNPYERRIIHSEVQKVEGATSTSIGEEPNRKVIISSTNPRPQRDNRSRNYNRRPRENAEGSDGVVDANRKPYRERSSKPYGGDRRRGPRGERRPSQTIDPKTVTERQVAPSEAKDLPLYGKINLDD